MSEVRIVEWDGDRHTWNNYVHSSVDGTVCHLHEWREVIQRAYGHRTFYLAATRHGEVCGILPLVLMHNPFLGRHLVSMPFMDYGGVVTQEGLQVRHQLVEVAMRLAQEYRASLSFRCVNDQHLDLPIWLEKVTMQFDLGKSEDELWKRLPSERRNRIRKAQKNGLVVSLHGIEALDAFYAVFATNMRDLGSPVHSRAFFRHMGTQLGPYMRIALVKSQEQTIGAACGLFYKDMIVLPWISSLRPFFHLCPNQLLYWEMMCFGIAHRYRVLDFGRASKGTGTLEAKRQWGAESLQLHWYYFPEAPPPGGERSRFSSQINLWRHLPVRIANVIGPLLRRGIPN